MKLCRKPPWHFLPIFLGISSLVGMTVTYLMAKGNCHIEKWTLPYISYTGTEHPESSVFGLLLNTEGFLGIVVVILAWKFLQHVDHKGFLNNAALLAGIMSCFGVIIVGNFQVSKTKVPHYIGAGLAFIIGTVYCTLSSILTFKLHKRVERRPSCSMFVCALRFTAAILMILSILILSNVGIVRLNLKHTQKNSSTLPKNDSEPVYRFPNGSCVPFINNVPPLKQFVDLAGSITEWALTICLLFSLALYAYEFKHFSNVKIILKKQGQAICFDTLKGSCRYPSLQQVSSHSTSPNTALLCPDNDTIKVPHSENNGINGRSSGLCMCKNNNKESCKTVDENEFGLSASLSNDTDCLREP